MNEQSRRRFSLLFLFAAAAVAFAPNGCEVPGIVPSQGPISVLVLRDRRGEDDLPQEKLAALQSSKASAYLETHCDKGENGPEFRIWDKSLTKDNITDAAHWGERFVSVKETAEAFPWVAIWRDSSIVYSGPMPDTEQAWLDLLKKHGGE